MQSFNSALFFCPDETEMAKIIRLKETDSTNKDAFTLANDGAEHGTAIIAATQSGGRGRLGKNWQSVPGKGLYCSIIVRPKLEVLQFPQLTFVAGLAVADAVSEIADVEVGLKWPNDIFLGQYKCGGILTESSDLTSQKADRFAIVGIGINVNSKETDFLPELCESATSLHIETGNIFDINQLFQAIHSHLLKKITWFEEEGFSPVINKWRVHDFLLGKELDWVSVSGEKIRGVSLGPDDEGRLHVRDGAGKVHEILSGDISLAK